MRTNNFLLAFCLVACTSLSIAQTCPGIAQAATESYSATFSGAHELILKERWELLQNEIKKCESIRGTKVILKEELGEDFFYRLKSPDSVLEGKIRKDREAEEEKAAGKGLFVHESVFNQLTQEDRENIRSKYPKLEIVNPNSVGKITSYQILDNSSTADNTGSRLGSLAGQAAYIDNSITNRTYSATGHLGAALIGSILGSSLDRPATRSFNIFYAIQRLDKSIHSISKISSNPTASPVGQCVFTKDISEAPFYLCIDSVVLFLSRVKELAALITTERSEIVRSELLKCKVQGIGTLSITESECKELKGIEMQ